MKSRNLHLVETIQNRGIKIFNLYEDNIWNRGDMSTQYNIYHIVTNEDIQEFITYALCQECIYMDIEFARKQTYFPFPCLIQFMISNNIYIFDIIEYKELNYGLLRILLSNQNIKKVLYGCTQDLKVIYQFLQIVIENVLDLQLCLEIQDPEDRSGFAFMATKYLNLEFSKEEQESKWYIRPYSQDQEYYIIGELIYMQKLYECTRDIQSKVKQEYDKKILVRYSNVDSSKLSNYMQKFASSLTSDSHNKEYKKLVRDVIAWRENLAQKMNIPRYKILSDKDLSFIVSNLNSKEPISKKIAHLPSSDQDVIWNMLN